MSKKTALGFVDWLMENCELAEDNSLWSYNGEDYTNEKLFKIYKSVMKGETSFEIHLCKVCGKPFSDKESLYEHFDNEHQHNN